MKYTRKYQNRRFISFFMLILFLLYYISDFYKLTAYAASDSTAPDYLAEAEERKSLPVATNQIENWPEGPLIGAEGAILLEANTGTILYAKNIDERLYPASTTKIMTCLLAVENAKLTDTITFSNNAVFSIESDSSNIGMDVGQSITLEQALYGILVGSANEVANATAEYVGGSIDDFVTMMNDRAAELGCKNTHFSNVHGLFDENHYTTAYDLALIAKAFFQNELLSKIGNTKSYHFTPTATQPDDFTIANKHQLISGVTPYEDIVGGKTGYTQEARQTLVTCAERNGMKLICVIMKEESPEQFNDTVKLFDYGFNNFETINVAENETKYNVQNGYFFQSGNDVFGSSNPILSLNTNSYLVIPKTITFNELDSQISYDNSDKTTVAMIDYSYHGAYVGSASVDLITDSGSTYDFGESESLTAASNNNQTDENVIFINIKTVLLIVLSTAGTLILIFVIHSVIKNYNFDGIKRRRKRRRKKRKSDRFDSEFRNFRF